MLNLLNKINNLNKSEAIVTPVSYMPSYLCFYSWNIFPQTVHNNIWNHDSGGAFVHTVRVLLSFN